MKTKKRRAEILSFYNHTGIESHLAEMARKGWMIEQISNCFWTYRKIEPKELHFTVTYYPKATDFDPVPSEAQQTLHDFCADTGWELACTWYQMQIFYNEAEDPVPINTDPVLEVETVHKACKASYLRGYYVLLVISFVRGLLFVSSLIGDTLRIIASPSDFMTGVCCLALFLMCAVELTAYHTWHRKAKKAAEYEIFLDTPSTSMFQRVLLGALGVGVAYWMINLIFGRDPLMAWIAVAMFMGIFATTILVNAVKQLLKRKQVSSGINRVLTAVSSFVIAFVLMGAVISVGVYVTVNIQPEDLLLYIETPLTVTDLLETEYNDYVTMEGSDESLLLTRLEINQRHGFDDESSPDIPEMNYEIFTVRVPAIYDFCENQMKRLIVLAASRDGELVEQDAAPWGADKVYHLVMNDGTEKNLYMLCYDYTLIRIELSWEPTAEQMAIIGEKLNK